MSQIPISAFVSVSISSPQAGLSVPALNNLAILTRETPVNAEITQADPGIYSSPLQVLADWGSASEVYRQAVAIFSQSPCIVDGGGSLIVYPMGALETLVEAMGALYPKQFFGGVLIAGFDPTDDDVIAAAETAESLKVNLIAASHQTAALTAETGLFARITQAHVDCFLYLRGATALAARIAAAAYASRKRSVDFNGSNTTTTMHGKSLEGILPDTMITPAILNTCQTVGVQVYASTGDSQQYLGVVYSAAREGLFPDSVYNRDWLQRALQVSVFNVLATNNTKVPQTEPGMAMLRAACIDVLERAITNGYIAPGNRWNSATVFGVPEDLRRSIETKGYYLYNLPTSQQNQADRTRRVAPVIQIAAKEAGAIHSANIIGHIEQ